MTRFTAISAALIVVALIVAACGGGDPTAVSQRTAPAPQPTVAPQPTATLEPAATRAPGEARPVATSVPTATPTAAPTPTPTGFEPRYGGTLNTRNIFDWTSWDTWHAFGGFSSMLVSNMFSNLLHPALNDLTTLAPDLAIEWDISDDGLTYTLKLRQDVKWHDGKPFTSADVKWNIDRGRTSEDPFISFNKRKVSIITEVETPDDFTVVMRLAQPSASFLASLAAPSMLMYPPHVEGVAPKSGAVGTGPFKYKRWQQDTVLEMTRNDDYYQTDEAGRSLPYVDEQHSFIITVSLALSAFRTGKIDCGCGYDHDFVTIAADQIRRDMPDANVFLILADQFNLLFNIERPPFDNQRVRQAFSMMLDRRALVLLPRGGHGRFPPHHMLSPDLGGQWGLPDAEIVQMPGFRESFEDEVAEAKRILQEEGIDPSSLNLVFQAILSPNVDPYHLAAQNLLLNASGAKIDVRQNRGAAFVESMAAKGWDISMTAGGTAYDDPTDVFLEAVTTTGSGNRARLDYGVDEMAAEQDSTLDFLKRREIIRDIQRKLINDAVYIPAVYQVDGYATNARVVGYIAPPFSVGPQFRLERLWLKF
ncbi:MAG: ABC transporter substrate-binding protein [Chloroflexi bacterium]|nr:ABC transporter substrate-binding protein [Chloroflexota bacterium]